MFTTYLLLINTILTEKCRESPSWHAFFATQGTVSYHIWLRKCQKCWTMVTNAQDILLFSFNEYAIFVDILFFSIQLLRFVNCTSVQFHTCFQITCVCIVIFIVISITHLAIHVITLHVSLKINRCKYIFEHLQHLFSYG